MTMTTRTSTGSFFSTVVPIRDGVLGERLDCPRLSSACSVTSSETDTSPGRRANTLADAGLTRCARLWPRAVQPSRFVRPQPVYPATGRRAASGGFARSGPGHCPRHAPLPRGRRGRVVDGLGCLHRFCWCRSCDVYGRGTACWTCSSTRVQWDHVPRWSSAVGDRQRPANGSRPSFARCCPDVPLS
jgi:hypothetical protein